MNVPPNTVLMYVTVKAHGDGRRLKEDAGRFGAVPNQQVVMTEPALKDMLYDLFERGWSVMLARTKGDYSHVTLWCCVGPMEPKER